jgi:transposase
MKNENPEWYMTPKEFGAIIILTLEENDYFKSNEKAHPQDIEYMFSIIGKAIAQGVSYAGTKTSQKNTQKKNALLTPRSLLK